MAPGSAPAPTLSVGALLGRLLALLLLVAATLVMAQLVGELNRVKQLKTDLAEIRHVQYGLLDADQWVARISAIIERRVRGFELTDANRPQVTRAVEQVLETLLTEVEHYLRERNLKGGGSWMDQIEGVLRQGLQDLLIDFERLRRKVPRYAEAIVEQLSTPEAKAEIEAQLLALVRNVSDSSFAKVDRAPLEALLARHDCPDSASCAQRLQQLIDDCAKPIRQRLMILAGLLGPMFALCLGWGWPWGRAGASAAGRGAPRGQLDAFRLLLLIGATLVLLAGGILAPMIEIEARVSELNLVLLGEPIVFSDQVLYFQSKSILEVVRILLERGQADMWLVALLVVLFSLVFPALKLIATYLYHFDLWGTQGSPWIRFLALRSGKWSMADVLVIALFMAYVGFDGLIDNQLGSLRGMGGESAGALGASVLTTNGTALAPGFHLFLAFVLASLLLSARIEKEADSAHATEWTQR